MLILQLKYEERVNLTTPAGKLTLFVAAWDAGKVRLHIQAPQDWLILRDELGEPR